MIVKAMGLDEISQVEKVVREAVGELGPSRLTGRRGISWEEMVQKEEVGSLS